MTQALPSDVQAFLKRSMGVSASPDKARKLQQTAMAPVVLDIEARDPRTASDVVLQLLAFRPASHPAAAAKLPAGLRSMYFTLQFYSFGPVVTESCVLAAGPAEDAQEQQQVPGREPAESTYMLLPVKQVSCTVCVHVHCNASNKELTAWKMLCACCNKHPIACAAVQTLGPWL